VRIAIDLDDTINYSKKSGTYGNEPLQDGAIEALRRWKAQGHYIIIHTARNMDTCRGNIGKALARQGLTTLQWLKDNDVPYDEIWWSKPHADIFIDDKGLKHTPGDWLSTIRAIDYLDRSQTTRVWINGCFDVLHIGHIKLIEFASTLGPLRVGLDSDSKVRADKGKGRPVNTFEDRKEMLKALRYGIEDVVTYDTNDELIQHIKEYRPSVILVGEEYRGKVVGSEYAGTVEYFQRYEFHSTTRIVEET